MKHDDEILERVVYTVLYHYLDTYWIQYRQQSDINWARLSMPLFTKVVLLIIAEEDAEYCDRHPDALREIEGEILNRYLYIVDERNNLAAVKRYYPEMVESSARKQTGLYIRFLWMYDFLLSEEEKKEFEWIIIDNHFNWCYQRGCRKAADQFEICAGYLRYKLGFEVQWKKKESVEEIKNFRERVQSCLREFMEKYSQIFWLGIGLSDAQSDKEDLIGGLMQYFMDWYTIIKNKYRNMNITKKNDSFLLQT